MGVQSVRSGVEIEGEGGYLVFTTVCIKDWVKTLTGGRPSSVLAEKRAFGFLGKFTKIGHKIK
jgi:hypothetical protein